MVSKLKTVDRLKALLVIQDMDQRQFLLWMLGGLLLRLLIIPFFCHADFLSEYRRVYMSIETGMYIPQLTRLVVYFIELFFMIICLPLIDNAETLFYLTNIKSSTAGLSQYFLFVSDPGIFRILFLLKIPYLIFDMGTAVLIFRMLAGKRGQFLALKIWLCNPVTLYAFYLFGRFESIPIFFFALTLRLAQKQRLLAAAVALGLTLNCRETYIILVPAFFLALVDFHLPWTKNIRRILPMIVIATGMFVLPLVLSRLFDFSPLYSAETTLESGRAAHLLDYRVHWLLPFVFAYALICLWLLENQGDVFGRLITASSLCMTAFFFCVSHSAHYVSWLMLFPAMMLYHDRDMLKPTVLLCCSWFGLWSFATDAGVFTLLLASPLSIKFSGWPTLPQWYTQTLGSQTVFNLGTAILIMNNLYHACLAYLCYKFFTKPHI